MFRALLSNSRVHLQSFASQVQQRISVQLSCDTVLFHNSGYTMTIWGRVNAVLVGYDFQVSSYRLEELNGRPNWIVF